MSERSPRDDTGVAVPLPGRVRRVVSLVPSLTETIAVSAPGLLAGATDWCSHPPGLDVPRVRGTKNPDLERIAGLRPDLVVMDADNGLGDQLTSIGIASWVGPAAVAFDDIYTQLEQLGAATGHVADAAKVVADITMGARTPMPAARARTP